jgi:hypothetical protein
MSWQDYASKDGVIMKKAEASRLKDHYGNFSNGVGRSETSGGCAIETTSLLVIFARRGVRRVHRLA